MSEIILKVENLSTSYGRIPMLMGVNMNVHKGSVCTVLGPNGAGKSTLVKAILGLVRADNGRIFFMDQDVTHVPSHKRIASGIHVASSATGTFPKMTVETNLRLGAYNIDDKNILEQRLEEVFHSFPILKNRLQQKAGTLSGGERTMLSISKAIINDTKILILDEPSLGLAPIIVDEVFRFLKKLHDERELTIMLVEQNINKALSISNFGYVIQKGQIIYEGDTSVLQGSDILKNPVM